MTFRKLLLLLCALNTLAQPVWATQSKLMVVYPDIKGDNKDTTSPGAASNLRTLNMWQNIFNETGVNATMIDGKLTKTLYCSTGQQVWNYGTPGAYVEAFNAVMLVNWKIGAQVNAGYPRVDSTLRIAYNSTGGPTVPQFWAFGDFSILTAGVPGIKDAACCTTGVSAASSELLTGSGQTMWKSGTTNPFFAGGPWPFVAFGNWLNGATPSSTVPAGGFRKHIDLGFSAISSVYGEHPQGTFFQCVNCDSVLNYRTATSASTDTVVLWERLYNESAVTYPNAKPAIFLWADGEGGRTPSFTDSVATEIAPMPCEVDPVLLLAGLARLDSVLNHTLITKSLKRSIVIHGLCSRGARLGSLGINPSDTTTAYASMDSIKAMGIRVVYTINADPDSMTAYSRDLIKALQNPNAKFAPEIWTGVSDTGLVAPFNGGATQFHRPRDVWGRYRNRIAYGDGSGVGKDSSLWANLMWAKFLCDSATGNRTSSILFAPMDDWSPKNVIGTLTQDSVLYAITKAHFTGVEIDAQYPASQAGSAGEGRTNPRGFTRQQGEVWDRLNGSPVKLLGQTGYFLGGANKQFISTASDVWIDFIGSSLNRIWAGYLLDYGSDNDMWTIPPMGGTKGWWSVGADDYTNREVYYRTIDSQWDGRPKRAYIANLRFNDISGKTNNGGDPAARWGWYVIKSIANGMRTVNEIDNKSVITLAYPEQIELP